VSVDGPVLVTGGAGFIGSRVVANLAARGVEVLRLDHSWSSRGELADRIGDAEIATCIHLGWYARPADYLTDAPANLASLTRSVELVDLLGSVGCRRLVVAGTCAEYAPSDQPHAETDRIAPRSVYGACKASLYLLLDSSWRPPSLGVTWARLFNVTGPGEHPDRLTPTVVRALLAERSVALSPGDQLRDFLDVDDVADALVHLSSVGVDGAVNVCSGHAISLRELLGALGDRLHAFERLRFGAKAYAPLDEMCVLGTDSRLAATGWAPAHPFDQMIDRVVAYWRSAAVATNVR
jgi:nucleoside-diphosphate-sugar epimerase